MTHTQGTQVEEAPHGSLAGIREIHTLGPSGTNCEMAASTWLADRRIDGEVVLYRTLEEALATMPRTPHAALLGCVVYPDLHKIVFGNLDRLYLADQFIVDTFPMVLAAPTGRALDELTTVGSHPAPSGLVRPEHTVVLKDSNAQAAKDCSTGDVDACITTSRAAQAHGLSVVTDFGPVPMGFTIHVWR